MAFRPGIYSLNGQNYKVFSTGRVDVIVPVRNSLNRSEMLRTLKQDGKVALTIREMAAR